MEIQKLTWKNCLDCKKDFEHISTMAWHAIDAGYRYFNWQGKIYYISDNLGEEYKDTGITAESVVGG